MSLLHELKKVNILLIDNDELIRDSLSLFFQCEGGHFLAVDSAEKGLKKLKEKKYDIIISDFMLPKINALQFFKLVNTNYPDSTKVLITSVFTNYIVGEAIMIGIRNFVQKPFTTKTIEKSLDQLLKNGNAHTHNLYLNGELLKFNNGDVKKTRVSL